MISINNSSGLAEKSGHLWECIGRSPYNRGYLYELAAKKIDEDPFKIQDNIFPSVEVPPAKFGEMIDWIPLKAGKYNDNKQSEFKDYVLSFLGYAHDRATQKLYLPDRPAIVNGWLHLQKIYPKLPNIKRSRKQNLLIHMQKNFMKNLKCYNVL